MGQDSYCSEEYWKEKGGKKKKSLQSRSKITPILKEDTNLGQKDCSLQWTPRNVPSKRFTGIYQPRWGQESRRKKKINLLSPHKILSLVSTSDQVLFTISPVRQFIQESISYWEGYSRDVIERQEISDIIDPRDFPTQDHIQANTKTTF